MDKYLKQKIAPSSVDPLQERIDFEQKLRQLKSAPVEMNSDLAQKVAKDLPVEHINTAPATKVKSSHLAMADIEAKIAERRAMADMARGKAPVQAAEEVLDYSQFKKAPKQMVENVYDAGAAKKEYEAMKKTAKSAGRLGKGALAAIGPIGAIGGALLAGSADEALANAVIPGGIEGLGAGSDQMLSPEELANVERTRELSAGEPMNQARLRAIQEMIKGRR
jgi:hypothetical protein